MWVVTINMANYPSFEITLFGCFFFFSFVFFFLLEILYEVLFGGKIKNPALNKNRYFFTSNSARNIYINLNLFELSMK